MASKIFVFSYGAICGGAIIGGLSFALKISDCTLRSVEGPSMRPTLNPCGSYISDILVVRKIRKNEEIESIDVSSILCIKHPKQERGYLVKRLVANQNEKLNTQTIHKIETKQSLKVIPKGHCWVESDAGPGYLDSTSYLGPIPYDMIMGKALYVIWPPHRIKKL